MCVLVFLSVTDIIIVSVDQKHNYKGVAKYEDRPVEKEKLDRILEAANIYNAPLAIIVCADHTKAWTHPFDGKKTTDIDASILTDHMMLEATELGLGSVWIYYFKPDVLKKEFQLPKHLEPVNILAIGYGNDTPADSERHSSARILLNELVSFESL